GLFQLPQVQPLHHAVQEHTQMAFPQLVFHAGRQQIGLIRAVRQKSRHTSFHALFLPRKQVCSHAHTEALLHPNSKFSRLPTVENRSRPTMLVSPRKCSAAARISPLAIRKRARASPAWSAVAISTSEISPTPWVTSRSPRSLSGARLRAGARTILGCPGKSTALAMIVA